MTGNRLLKKQAAQSKRAGQDLATALRAGVPIQKVATPVPLRPGEYCVAHGAVAIAQHVAVEKSYLHKHGGMAFTWKQVAARAVVQWIGNRRRRKRAERESAARWRIVDQGQMWLTNYRFAIQASIWTDYWHHETAFFPCTGLAIELQTPGAPPTRLHVAQPDWWYTMLHWIAFETDIALAEAR